MNITKNFKTEFSEDISVEKINLIKSVIYMNYDNVLMSKPLLALNVTNSTILVKVAYSSKETLLPVSAFTETIYKAKNFTKCEIIERLKYNRKRCMHYIVEDERQILWFKEHKHKSNNEKTQLITLLKKQIKINNAIEKEITLVINELGLKK